MVATELWFRNPTLYIKELVECDAYNYTFDKGTLIKRRVDVGSFLDMHVPSHANWRLLVMDDDPNICFEFDREHGALSAIGAHPMWTMKMGLKKLENLMQNYQRVIYLQEGVATLPEEFAARQEVAEMQLEYPKCILHIKNSWSYRFQFGMPFGAADIDGRTRAANGKLVLPDGSQPVYNAEDHQERIRYACGQLGVNIHSLDVPRNRCMFNIRSAQWAAKYYKDREAKPTYRRTKQPVDFQSAEFKRLQVATARVRLPQSLEKREDAFNRGDFFLCNACSLQTKCDFFRFGAVCAVPGSEPTDLARMMGSSDAEVIKAGLSNLLMFQSNRVIEAAQAERDADEIDPELTKMINTLFDRGVKMVKLMDPSARGGVQINMPGSHQTQIVNADPKAVLAGIIAELEGRGVDRQSVSKDMIVSILSAEDRRKAIDGVVLASKTEVA